LMLIEIQITKLHFTNLFQERNYLSNKGLPVSKFPVAFKWLTLKMAAVTYTERLENYQRSVRPSSESRIHTYNYV
jgi:ABC-type cobalamin transport system ATPase subunit